MDERQVVLRNRLPSNSEGAEIVVPAVGAFHDPAARPTTPTAERILPTATNVRSDPASSDLLFAIRVVVALVEADVARATRPTRRAQRYCVEGLRNHPLVVDVRTGKRNCQRNTASVGQDVALGAELGTIGRIGTCEVPPFGAFTEALSREDQVQSIPRLSS